MHVELVADLDCAIGENPLWHPVRHKLYFLDIGRNRVHEFDPDGDHCRVYSEGRVTGGMVLAEDGDLLLFQDGAVARCDEKGRQTILADGLCRPNQRFNDVIADPHGRVFAGTIGEGPGELLRFDRDGTVCRILDDVGIANGLGFSPDLQHCYFTDSKRGEISVFAYDPVTGVLADRRQFAVVDAAVGVPDGMAVDDQGDVWSAVWFGGCLLRHATPHHPQRVIHLPVAQTSALAFAGEDGADIYVTTAATDAADDLMPAGYQWHQPRGGGLFRIRGAGLAGGPWFTAGVPCRVMKREDPL